MNKRTIAVSIIAPIALVLSATPAGAAAPPKTGSATSGLSYENCIGSVVVHGYPQSLCGGIKSQQTWIRTGFTLCKGVKACDDALVATIEQQ
jgi:hypothetical protein